MELHVAIPEQYFVEEAVHDPICPQEGRELVYCPQIEGLLILPAKYQIQSLYRSINQ